MNDTLTPTHSELDIPPYLERNPDGTLKYPEAVPADTNTTFVQDENKEDQVPLE